MSLLDGIRSDAEAARLSFEAAKTLVSQASDEAGDLAQSAAEHGWTGLAEAMSSVREALQDAVQGITGARDATTESLARLSTIAAEMSSEEVAGRLARIVAALASARTAATVATASLEDPRSVAQQADAHRVVERIDAAEEQLAAGGGSLSAAVTSTENEQAAAAGWGGTPGSARSPGGQVPSTTTRQAGSPGDEELTEPSRSPDPDATPEGHPETAPRASRDVQESLEYQNRTALALARAGYRVRRLPNTGQGVNPDFDVEGRIFDCYTPNRGTTADAAVTRIRKKSKLQASRFVVNLDRGGLEVDDLRGRLAASRPSRVLEVLVVRNDAVSRVWP